ncbi:GTPase domain-containing protein [Actinomadura scrupuli]|uniref:GTPase domain-containing protein n=1 Tax=Actinomadura scrupuli TaxID=559629 RepID=UPI003D967463
MAVGLGVLRKHNSRPGFRVCFVGGFSVGKSHLINQLLGAHVLAEHEIPTAPWTSVIRASDAGDHRDDGLADGATDRLVRVESPWLRGADLELLDTPGLWGEDRGEVDRTQTVRRLTQSSDAVVLLVRAVGGSNLQERELLREIVYALPETAVMLVVTMLDDVRGDRSEVLKRHRALARKISPRIEVFPGPGGDSIRPHSPDDLSALRDRLTELAGMAQNGQARIRQIAAVLIGFCDELEALAAEALVALGASEAGRTATRRAIDLQYQASVARWTAARLELENHGTALGVDLEAGGGLLRDRLIEEVEKRVGDHTDPRALWLDELSGWIRTELRAHAADVADVIAEAFARDAVWLDKELDAVVGPRAEDLRGSGAGAGADIPEDPQVRPPILSAGVIETLSTIVTEGGGALAELVISSYASAEFMRQISAVLQEAAQRGVRERLIERQRESVRDSVRRIVDDFCLDLTELGRARIAALYGRLIKAGGERHAAWWDSRLALWDHPQGQDQGWERLRAEARYLRAEIATAAETS